MLLSTINISHCGRWQKIRLIFNAIGCCNFGTIPAGTRPSCSNMLVVKCCGCVHQIASSQLQLRHFNQTAAISTTNKLLTKGAAAGNEQQPKPSQLIYINESQQQTQNNPETTEDEQQPKQQQNETDKPQHLILAKASIAIGPNRNIEIECHQGTRGNRFIQISRLPNIPVPLDAYKFVAALDRLIGQLPVEKPTNSEKDIGSQRVLAFQMLEKGVNYDFNLSIVWHQEKGGCHLRIRRVQTSEKHKEREVHFPLWALPQLRQQMATILEEYDGTERIDEMPTIPEWATQEEQQESNGESDEQKKQQIKVGRPFNLAKMSIAFGGQNNRKLQIECRKGSSGHKTINLIMITPKKPATIYDNFNFSKIRVPQMAYKFLGAMDGLIGQLPVEEPANPEGNKRPILACQMLVEDSQPYSFKLSVVWHQKEGQWHLYIKSVQTSEKHKKKEVHFPLWALPQMRQQMATMLEEHDGTERIDEMPTIPEWATQAPSIQLRIDKMPPLPEWAKQAPNIRLKSRFSN